VKKLIGMSVSLIMAAWLCQGCVPVLIGAVAVNHGLTKSNYAAYVRNTQKDNTDREEHGLRPNPILSYADWKKGVAQPVAGLTNSASADSTNTTEAVKSPNMGR